MHCVRADSPAGCCRLLRPTCSACPRPTCSAHTQKRCTFNVHVDTLISSRLTRPHDTHISSRLGACACLYHAHGKLLPLRVWIPPPVVRAVYRFRVRKGVRSPMTPCGGRAMMWRKEGDQEEERKEESKETSKGLSAWRRRVFGGGRSGQEGEAGGGGGEGGAGSAVPKGVFIVAMDKGPRVEQVTMEELQVLEEAGEC